MLGGLFTVAAVYAAFASIHMFPPAPYGLADDWRVFYAAAHVIAAGGNPYDPATMHAAEQEAQHYTSVQPSLDDFTDLPVVGLLLRAFTWLPYWWSFAVFSAAGLTLAGVTLRFWLHDLGWPAHGWWVAAALLSWPLLLALFSGQFDLMMLAGLVASLALMARRRPVLAGAAMVVVLFKPHLLWPLPLLLGAAWMADAPALRRFIVTAAIVLLGGAAAGFLLVPHSLAFFPHLLGFDTRISSDQPDLSGIPGLLAHLPQGALIGDAVAAAGILGVLALGLLGGLASRQRSLTPEESALIPLVGLTIWLACTPYAHPNDDVLIFPLLAVVVGVRGSRLDPRWLELGIVGALAVIVGFVAGQGVGTALVALIALVCLLLRHRTTVGSLAALGLASLALLPDVWPFHVVAVSPTPVAVAAVAVAGLRELRERSLVQVRSPRPTPLSVRVAGG
jgi:hypothetical protein